MNRDFRWIWVLWTLVFTHNFGSEKSEINNMNLIIWVQSKFFHFIFYLFLGSQTCDRPSSHFYLANCKLILSIVILLIIIYEGAPRHTPAHVELISFTRFQIIGPLGLMDR